MGSGIMSGLMWGTMTSVIVLGVASTMAPLPPDGEGDVAVLRPAMPERPDVDGTPVQPVARTTPQKTVAAEIAAELAVPAGSEFRRALVDEAAVLPSAGLGAPARTSDGVAQPSFQIAAAPKLNTAPSTRPSVAAQLEPVAQTPGGGAATGPSAVGVPALERAVAAFSQPKAPPTPGGEAAPEAHTVSAGLPGVAPSRVGQSEAAPERVAMPAPSLPNLATPEDAAPVATATAPRPAAPDVPSVDAARANSPAPRVAGTVAAPPDAPVEPSSPSKVVPDLAALPRQVPQSVTPDSTKPTAPATTTATATARAVAPAAPRGDSPSEGQTDRQAAVAASETPTATTDVRAAARAEAREAGAAASVPVETPKPAETANLAETPLPNREVAETRDAPVAEPAAASQVAAERTMPSQVATEASEPPYASVERPEAPTAPLQAVAVVGAPTPVHEAVVRVGRGIADALDPLDPLAARAATIDDILPAPMRGASPSPLSPSVTEPAAVLARAETPMEVPERTELQDIPSESETVEAEQGQAADPAAEPEVQLAQAETTPQAEAPQPQTEVERGVGVRIVPLTERKPSNALPGRRITVGQSSRLGDNTDEPEAESAATETETEAEANDEPKTALARHAADFENPEDRAKFSVVLIDAGTRSVPRDVLAQIQVPVTFAIDPTAEDAATIAADYRAAGFEVLMLAGELPPSPAPQDVETALGAWIADVPEAVGLIDTAGGLIAKDRAVSSQIAQALAADGHGLVLYDKGLNSAKGVAENAGVATGLAFRMIDAQSERPTVIGRYLDRAAFKAAQEGAVIVVGHTYPDTITALTTWALEGKGQTMAMAPVSAILQQN